MSTNNGEQQWSYTIDRKVMLTAIVTLFFVANFVVLLHLYALCYLRRRRRAISTTTTTTTTTVFNHPTTGLNPEAIAALPTFPYKKSNNSTSECAVCISLFEDGEEVRSLPNCKHTFHVECIDMWLHSHPTCPICRSDAEPAIKVVEVGDVAIAVEDGSSAKEAASTSRLGSSLRRMLSGDWSGRRSQPTEGVVEDLERGSSG